MHCEVRACEQRGKCDGFARKMRARGRGHIKMNVLPDIGKPLISIGKSKWFPNIAKTFMDLLMSKIIKRFPMSVIISLNREILDKCPFDVPGPFYWHGLILIPVWISHHMLTTGKMGGKKSLLRSQTPKVLNGTVKIRKWIISSHVIYNGRNYSSMSGLRKSVLVKPSLFVSAEVSSDRKQLGRRLPSDYQQDISNLPSTSSCTPPHEMTVHTQVES